MKIYNIIQEKSNTLTFYFLNELSNKYSLDIKKFLNIEFLTIDLNIMRQLTHINYFQKI
jgi:hypothetical protein